MSNTESSRAQPATLAVIVALVVGAAVSVIYGTTAGSAIALSTMIIVDVVVVAVVLTALIAIRTRRSRS